MNLLTDTPNFIPKTLRNKSGGEIMEEKTIAPIQTYYNGYHFRSRLEARWAVFFDEIGVEYEYEPEGFKLSDGTCYLPDFYLPKFSTYIEIKHTGLTEEDRKYSTEEILNIFKEENNCDTEHFYAILANEYTIILSDNFEGVIELD